MLWRCMMQRRVVCARQMVPDHLAILVAMLNIFYSVYRVSACMQ